MDTVEELNNTYFYAGRSNLSASELLFMIFCEKTAEQLGLGEKEFVALIGIFSGISILPTRTKPKPAKAGTSIASVVSRAVFPNHIMFPWGLKLPTFVGGMPPHTLRLHMVRKIGAFTGRSIPVAGWAIAAYDVSQISFKTMRDYHAIARGKDKIW